MALLADLNTNNFHGTESRKRTLVDPLMGSPGAERKQRQDLWLHIKRVSVILL